MRPDAHIEELERRSGCDEPEDQGEVEEKREGEAMDSTCRSYQIVELADVLKGIAMANIVMTQEGITAGKRAAQAQLLPALEAAPSPKDFDAEHEFVLAYQEWFDGPRAQALASRTGTGVETNLPPASGTR